MTSCRSGYEDPAQSMPSCLLQTNFVHLFSSRRHERAFFINPRTQKFSSTNAPALNHPFFVFFLLFSRFSLSSFFSHEYFASLDHPIPKNWLTALQGLQMRKTFIFLQKWHSVSTPELTYSTIKASIPFSMLFQRLFPPGIKRQNYAKAPLPTGISPPQHPYKHP